MNASLKRKFVERKKNETRRIEPGLGSHLTIILAFPATYRIALSNLGFHLIYLAFNSIPGVCCHRVFYPDACDEESFISGKETLRSFETSEPIGNYDVLAFSLAYENDLPHAIRMMKFGTIQPFQNKRTPQDPIVMAGGVIATVNPEPVAEYFDFFVLGEGEEIVPVIAKKLIGSWSRSRDRKLCLTELEHVSGIYIPSFYQASYDVSGRFSGLHYVGNLSKPKLERRILKDLNPFPASSVIYTPNTEFSQMHIIEISRGCPRQCHFCMIHASYAPFRFRSMKTVMDDANDAPPGFKVGLLGAGMSDHPDLISICRNLIQSGREISLSSLHATQISNDMEDLIREGGIQTITLAPETGSEGFRRKTGKFIADKNLFNAARLLANSGIQNLKLYFMIGLPGEPPLEIDAMIDFCKKIRHEILSNATKAFTGMRITISASCFVPKAMTPYERAPMLTEKELNNRLVALQSGLKKIHGVVFTHDLPKWAIIQGLLSRGDRRLSEIIFRVAALRETWKSALRQFPINPDYILHRKRLLSDKLPWDHLKG